MSTRRTTAINRNDIISLLLLTKTGGISENDFVNVIDCLMEYDEKEYKGALKRCEAFGKVQSNVAKVMLNSAAKNAEISFKNYKRTSKLLPWNQEDDTTTDVEEGTSEEPVQEKTKKEVKDYWFDENGKVFINKTKEVRKQIEESGFQMDEIQDFMIAHRKTYTIAGVDWLIEFVLSDMKKEKDEKRWNQLTIEAMKHGDDVNDYWFDEDGVKFSKKSISEIVAAGLNIDVVAKFMNDNKDSFNVPVSLSIEDIIEQVE